MAASGETVVIGARDQDIPSTGTAGTGAAYVFDRSGGVWTERAFLKPSPLNGDDYFGTSVAISGDTIVVGAPEEDSAAIGVDGNETNIDATDSGAAYVFIRSGTMWTKQAYLKASNTGPGDAFGWSVAVAGDTVVVGAYLEDSNAKGVGGAQNNELASGSGAAYVFARNGTAWSQEAYLKASNTDANDFFGHSVATTGGFGVVFLTDVNTVVVGARSESSNAIGVNPPSEVNLLTGQYNNSVGNSGAVYFFGRAGRPFRPRPSTWSQEAYLKASNTGNGDNFGGAIAISDGTLVVGAYTEDSNAIGVNENQANNSAGESGAAYVFNIQQGTFLGVRDIPNLYWYVIVFLVLIFMVGLALVLRGRRPQ